MADDGVALFGLTSFKKQPYTHLLGARATKTELFREVIAQRASDEEKGFSVFDRFFELPVRAREHRRAPWCELIRLETTRQQHSVPAVTSELTLQLSRADGRHRTERAKTQKVKALQLLLIERELVRRERGEERARIFDLHEAAWSRARCGELG